VQVHEDDRLGFDDMIKGKGKGMVFLLHGEPGVGKTLTAGELFLHH
jgi:DNA polymerase III delta prime subunit